MSNPLAAEDVHLRTGYTEAEDVQLQTGHTENSYNQVYSIYSVWIHAVHVVLYLNYSYRR